MCLYTCVIKLGTFCFRKGVGCMYSPEFMRFLINYQKPDYNDKVNKSVKTFDLNPRNGKWAAILLPVRK